MKKLLGILVLAFLFSGNANAGVNEPGRGPVKKCESNFKLQHAIVLHEVKKIYLESGKKINVVVYGSCPDNELGNYSFGAKKGKNLKALHKKTYKTCLKGAKKWNTAEDCYLYAVNEEVVWKHDLATIKAEEAKVKAEEERLAQIDKKPGRFFEDQPDANDDYQFHFIYLIALDGKDTELDISGWLEKRLTTVNNKFEKWSKKNKKSNGIGQKFKFDYRKDGKLDITFVRTNISKKKLGAHDSPNDIIYSYLRAEGFDNPKKVYATFTGFKSKRGNSDGGEGGVPYMIIYTPAVKTYGIQDMDIVILHEMFHAQGAAYACGKRTYDGKHVKGSDVLGTSKVSSTSIDSNNNTYYKHDIEGCPDLAKSVFVTPTAEDSWDPFDVFCRHKRGNFTHKDLYREFRGCRAGAN